jgi:glutathione S-transferase
MLTFYQEPFSHWCVKAKKIMDYKKIRYETINVGYHDKRELIKATGQDYVPALINDGQIVTYPDVPDFLEKLQANPTIYPEGTRALAKAMENWAHYRLEDVVWCYAVVDFPKTFKDDLERWIFVEIQELKRGPLELLEVRRPALKAEMEDHLQLVEDMLRGHRFLLTEKPSLADFAVFGAVNPLAYSGNRIPEKFPKLNSWYESIDHI